VWYHIPEWRDPLKTGNTPDMMEDDGCAIAARTAVDRRSQIDCGEVSVERRGLEVREHNNLRVYIS